MVPSSLCGGAQVSEPGTEYGMGKLEIDYEENIYSSFYIAFYYILL